MSKRVLGFALHVKVALEQIVRKLYLCVKIALAQIVSKLYLCIKLAFIQTIRKLPLISGLPDLKASDLSEAFKEIVVTFLLATMPLWLGAFIASLLDNSYNSSEALSFIDTLYSKLLITAQSGVLIAYSATMVAPILYIALSDSGRNSRIKFPSQISHIMVVLMVTVVSAAYYTATLISKDNLNEDFVYYTSIVLFVFSTLVYYIALCYKYYQSTYSHSEAVSDSTHKFQDQFSRFIERSGK